MEKIRLNKFISDSGYCSRREADQYIEQGRVTINNVDVMQQGAMVALGDRVEVDGELIKTGKKNIYIALNKPVGVTSTTDTNDKTNIIDFIGHKERIFPIGRLDKLSHGLILLTNDGNIVNKILRSGNSHQKEYLVTVNKPITDDFIKRMAKGVYIIDEGVTTLPCQITKEGETNFRIILTQGMNRQIRKMCEALRYRVTKLCRVRIMNITLSGIPEGSWRYLTAQEVEHINQMSKESVGTEEASATSQRRRRSAPKAGGAAPKREWSKDGRPSSYGKPYQKKSFGSSSNNNSRSGARSRKTR